MAAKEVGDSVITWRCPTASVHAGVEDAHWLRHNAAIEYGEAVWPSDVAELGVNAGEVSPFSADTQGPCAQSHQTQRLFTGSRDGMASCFMPYHPENHFSRPAVLPSRARLSSASEIVSQGSKTFHRSHVLSADSALHVVGAYLVFCGYIVFPWSRLLHRNWPLHWSVPSVLAALPKRASLPPDSRLPISAATG